MNFYLDEEMQNTTNIKVIGVGGGGGNARNAQQHAHNDDYHQQLHKCEALVFDFHAVPSFCDFG
ncbi:MAG: hypothetical protein RR198_07015 [Oscillospiraceae bacterium]